MLNSKRNKVKTISEKVTELIAKEDGLQSNEESEDETAPKVVDFAEEYVIPDGRSTDIRKRNIKLLSEQSAKYRGKISSRKDFEKTNESDEEDETLQSDSEDMDDYDQDDSPEEIEQDYNENVDDDDESEESGDDEGDDSDDLDDKYDDDDSANIVSETNRQAEIQKGQCVQNQLRMWERLLELRIHSQKLITKANQLPLPEELQEQKKDSIELEQLSQDSSQRLCKLLNSMLQLQQTLASQNSEMKVAMKESLKRPANFESVDQPPLKRISDHMSTQFEAFKTYRNGVLIKWDDRTKLLTPGAGAKKKSFNEDFDIIRKIDNTLMNKTGLLEKSRTLKNGAPSEGVAGTVNAHGATPNPEIYDDSDFYHQQLRELIEYKANTASNMSEVTKQYVELQKLRQQMKKKVDTRASKGRKLRYTVHNKLVNFMAPDETCITWTEESTNELSKSLFAA